MKEHTRLARARRGIERRLFLKAIGLGMAAPVAWQLSRSAIVHAAGARPKRLMVFFMPHGAPPEHYNPVWNTATPNEFTLINPGVSILGSLEPYKQYVNVLQGFRYPGASTHQGILTVLSNFGDGQAVDDTTPRTTFEHVIANGLGVRPLVLGAVPHRSCGIDQDGKLMWDGQYVVPEKNPLVAFERVFTQSETPPDVNLQLRNALTSLTEGQLSSLSSELAGLTRSQNKLSIHLESIQSLRLGANAQQGCDMVPMLPALELVRQQSAVAPPADPNSNCGGYFLSEDNFPTLLDAQLQLAAQALICNATPVVAVQPMYTNADINFAFMGSPGSHHSALSHTSPGGTGTGLSLTTRDAFAKAQKWFVDKLVTNVIDQLNVPDPADPGRLVIDNTIVYMFSEIGEGAFHTSSTRRINFDYNIQPPAPLAYMPIVTIGGGGGALKTGQVIRVNNNPDPPQPQDGDPGDRPAGDIYLALCQAMGVSVSSFGNATNPLTEILV